MANRPSKPFLWTMAASFVLLLGVIGMVWILSPDASGRERLLIRVDHQLTAFVAWFTKLGWWGQVWMCGLVLLLALAAVALGASLARRRLRRRRLRTDTLP